MDHKLMQLTSFPRQHKWMQGVIALGDQDAYLNISKPKIGERLCKVLHWKDQDAHERALDTHTDQDAIQPDSQVVEPF